MQYFWKIYQPVTPQKYTVDIPSGLSNLKWSSIGPKNVDLYRRDISIIEKPSIWLNLTF